jgi:hypothetical protein
VEGSCEDSNKKLGSINSLEALEQLSDCRLLKKDSVRRSCFDYNSETQNMTETAIAHP